MNIVAQAAAYNRFGKQAEGSTAAEVMKNAGLDYGVSIEPLYTSQGKEIRTQFRRVFRTDNDDTLGVVGKNYKVLSNAEMFDVADSIVGEGLAEWDRVASIGHGEKVMTSLILPEGFRIGSADEVEQMVYLMNSHDGSSGLKALPTIYRPFCGNQTAAIYSFLQSVGINPRHLTVRHTGSMHDRIDDLKRILNVTDTFAERFAEQANALLKVEISEKDRVAYYIDSLGLKVDDNISTNAYGLSTRGLNTLEAVLALEEAPTNTTGGMAGTAWGMFNTLTEYMDHGWVSNADGSFNHKRAESALIGVGSRLKGKAWEGALLLAA